MATQRSGTATRHGRGPCAAPAGLAQYDAHLHGRASYRTRSAWLVARLRLDLLQRFGEDLLGVLEYLEEQGINHRDIKPDNIAIGYVGSGKKLHLTVFDFSLSRVPIDQIRAGTRNYLEPFLEERKPHDHRAHLRFLGGLTHDRGHARHLI